MKKSRFREQQIIGFIKQADAGMPVKELCRKGGFSDAMFYKWRAKFAGMDASDAAKRKSPGKTAGRERIFTRLTPLRASDRVPIGEKWRLR